MKFSKFRELINSPENDKYLDQEIKFFDVSTAVESSMFEDLFIGNMISYNRTFQVFIHSKPILSEQDLKNG